MSDLNDWYAILPAGLKTKDNISPGIMEAARKELTSERTQKMLKMVVKYLYMVRGRTDLSLFPLRTRM